MNPIRLIKNLFKIAKILSVDDSGDYQFATVSAMGKTQKVLMLKPYGLMSNPPAGSIVGQWSQNGQESNGIGLADDPKNRPIKDMAEGEVGLGNYVTGDYLYFDETGTLNVVASTKVIVTAPTVKVVASVEVRIESPFVRTDCETFTVIASTGINFNAPAANFGGGTVTHDGTNIGRTHKHTQNDDSRGDTQANTNGPF